MALTLEAIRSSNRIQVLLGLFFGILFGFFLQKAGVVRYEVVVGQLLLTDFTVLKVMLSAVIVGTVGYHLLKHAGLVRSHAVPGSAGSNVIGGLVFGIGFALLGYCPGTVAGAAGSGALDAASGGFSGLLIGSWLFARIYPAVEVRFLNRGKFGPLTLPELLQLNEWVVVTLFVAASFGLLFLLEANGL
jgi:hypothetical protein